MALAPPLPPVGESSHPRKVFTTSRSTGQRGQVCKYLWDKPAPCGSCRLSGSLCLLPASSMVWAQGAGNVATCPPRRTIVLNPGACPDARTKPTISLHLDGSFGFPVLIEDPLYPAMDCNRPVNTIVELRQTQQEDSAGDTTGIRGRAVKVHSQQRPSRQSLQKEMCQRGTEISPATLPLSLKMILVSGHLI